MTQLITMKKAKKMIICIACICVLVSMCTAGLNASAITYSGRGSKSDPYLIYTAEQLNGIRDNLSGHYKLANTIDLASNSNFKPIGSLKTPFKGSLSCDLDANGKPLYAIKNLNMQVSPGGSTKSEGFSGYKKDGSSGWEAGLFGCADGALFTNVLVLNSNVTSTVQGLYQMNGDFTVNPGTDDMAAGILVAIGKGIKVKGCGVSGKVTSSSNHVGGMLGYIYDSTVSQSWSVATVTSTGSWGSGGLVGSGKGTIAISESFYDGTFTGGETHAGAFAGSLYGNNIKIKDCWSGGTVKTDTSGCFLGTKNHTDDNSMVNTDIASQCYTVSKIAGRTQSPTLKRLKNANYAAQEAGVLEAGFCAATQDEINTAFKSFASWSVKAGSYPQLNSAKVANADDYKPLKNIPQNTTSGGTENNQSTDVQSDNASGTDSVVSDDTSVESTDETTSALTSSTNDDDAMRVMSQTSETLLVVTLSILSAAALAGSAVTIVLIIKKRTKIN